MMSSVPKNFLGIFFEAVAKYTSTRDECRTRRTENTSHVLPSILSRPRRDRFNERFGNYKANGKENKE